VEVDLEEGLPEAINLTVAGWTHVQELDYEQLPFKCRHCHGHGHFAKHCKKKSEEQVDKNNGEAWTLVQKNVNSKKGKGKSHLTGGPSSDRNGIETDDTSKGTTNAQNKRAKLTEENGDQVEEPPSSKGGGEAHHIKSNQGTPSNPSYAEIAKKIPEESSGSSEDETFERPSKKAGRKSRKEKREEEAERHKTQGSHSTIEMSIG
jgi:hypothetical protein